MRPIKTTKHPKRAKNKSGKSSHTFSLLQGLFNRRRGRSWRSSVKSIMLITAMVGIGIIAWLGYPNQAYMWGQERLIIIAQHIGFRVHEIYVDGRHHLSAAKILKVVDLKRGDSIFIKSPLQIQQQLQELAWVQKVTVQRQLPGTIFINLTERLPIALWQNKKVHYLVDSEGVILSSDNLGAFAKLPIIVGSDAPLHAPLILKMLKNFPNLMNQVTAIVHVGGRRWDLFLNKVFQAKLPEEKLEQALLRLNDFINAKKIDPQVTSVVDLRVPGQLIIRSNPVEIAKASGKGKET